MDKTNRPASENVVRVSTQDRIFLQTVVELKNHNRAVCVTPQIENQ
jgi:hypothetical protein